MCIDREPTWGTEVHHTGLCQFLETCFSKRAAKGEILMRQDDLLVLDCTSIDFLGLQFTTCDYIKGTKGHYMPKENFLYFRKSERMVAKITLPTPIYLLDHIIIPIHIRKSHWFPAHINLRTHGISLLDSSQTTVRQLIHSKECSSGNSSGWYGQRTQRRQHRPPSGQSPQRGSSIYIPD